MRLVPRRLRHGEEATLVEHLGELRSRLVFCLIALAVGFGVAFAFHVRIIHWLNGPLPDKLKPTTLGVAEPFLTSMVVSLWVGFAIAFPIILWQLWGFLAPAFQEHTQRMLVGFVLFATVLLAGGLVFGYFIALPAAVHFLTNYDSSLYNTQIRAKDYYSFVLLVLAAVGVVFELPIFVLAMVRIGILTTAKLRRNRRIGYVIVAAVAVALPGVDPVTTLLEMAPLMILFECSIWLSVFFEKRWKSREAAREAAFQGGGDF
jgi:sec-independent protein translocase protein TatC